MTTPTATSELGGGLPDIAALTQIANELFSAVPNSEAPALPSRPVGLSAPLSTPSVPSLGSLNPQPQVTNLPLSPPTTVSQPATGALLTPPSVITPRLVPTQAQSADAAAITATTQPALTRWGGPALGVPEGPAANAPAALPLPSATEAVLPASTPSSPYYFLNESTQQAQAPTSNGLDRHSAHSLILPGDQDLSQLSLKGSPREIERRDAPAPGGYYFVSSPEFARDRTQAPRSSAIPQSRIQFDVNAIRRDFPILQERVNGRPLIWLDNAATTQKPQAVIDRLAHYYAHENSNIHRAAHELAARSTDAYEAARQKVARFLGASSPEEIIFVRGATEAINLIAKSWGRQHIGEGDEIIVSQLEHHANIVPWQQLASEVGAKLCVIPVDDSGQVLLNEYQKLLNSRTKLVSVTQVSNALGTIVPVKPIIDAAHAVGARVLVDGAQSVSHLRVNVQALGADFFVFSGHKIFGPTGIGAIYGRREVLEQTPPWQGGGNMIADVTFKKTVYQGVPARFEAGTGNIADAVGLGAALDYLERIGLETVAAYEHELLEYATEGLRTIPGLRLIGTAQEKTSVLSFILNGYKTEEVGKALNQDGIAVRAGHHCAQPILRRFGVESTVRPSLAFYNTHQEIDTLVSSVRRLALRR